MAKLNQITYCICSFYIF